MGRQGSDATQGPAISRTVPITQNYPALVSVVTRLRNPDVCCERCLLPMACPTGVAVLTGDKGTSVSAAGGTRPLGVCSVP